MGRGGRITDKYTLYFCNFILALRNYCIQHIGKYTKYSVK